jgi:TPR repeat protein
MISYLEQENMQSSISLDEIDQAIKKECHIFVDFGMNFIRKENPIDLDWKNAAYYFLLAYEEGNIEGAWRYGFCLYLGKGIQKNMAEGKTIIWTAAQIGSFDALWISYILFGLPSGKFELLYNNNYPAALWQESCFITNRKVQNELRRKAAESGEYVYASQYLNMLINGEIESENSEKDILLFKELLSQKFGVMRDFLKNR